MERSALQAAQSMGPNTNAGLDAQIKANGSLGYTPQAIKEVTKLNDALTTGVQSYQPGLERAIAANPAAGVLAKRQYDQQWGANFDPNIFKYYNAIKSGDTAEQQAVVKQLGGLNSPGYNAMMKKAQDAPATVEHRRSPVMDDLLSTIQSANPNAPPAAAARAAVCRARSRMVVSTRTKATARRRNCSIICNPKKAAAIRSRSTRRRRRWVRTSSRRRRSRCCASRASSSIRSTRSRRARRPTTTSSS